MKAANHPDSGLESWLRTLASGGGALGELLAAPRARQEEQGYVHTLREIAQQPFTWERLGASALRWRDGFAELIRLSGVRERRGTVLLTGSGSSQFLGECVTFSLRQALGVRVETVPAGLLLTHAAGCLTANAPALLVSFGRSGNSPESCGAIQAVLDGRFDCRHLIVTCNPAGRLAVSFLTDLRVRTLVLDEITHDRGLAMTSSVTNMMLAARLFAHLEYPGGFRSRLERLARAARDILLKEADGLDRIARGDFNSAVYLGTADHYGAARESSIKMIEMTAGRVRGFPESFLGLRHGPMVAVDSRTLIVAFLSSDPLSRAYELDLLAELARKRLGASLVIVGAAVPAELRAGALVIDTEASGVRDDADLPTLDLLVGQLLAFFRCRRERLLPDNPAPGGVINRVVESFRIHGRNAVGGGGAGGPGA